VCAGSFLFDASRVSLGKKYRLRSIFKDDGKALVVAMDHGMIGNVQLSPILNIAEKVIKGGADALLVTPAAARYLIEKLSRRVPLVLSIPYDPQYVELAVKLSADAVKTTYFGRVPLDWDMMEKIWAVARACDEWGMPYMVEIVPCDDSGKILYDLEKVKQAARIGGELGGDLVKTTYVGPSKAYRTVIESTFVPITIMGGPKMDTVKELLTVVKEAVDAGATGGTIGRNIWQHEDPERMVKALISIIHENKDVEDVLKIVER